jgi:hypothetical protein
MRMHLLAVLAMVAATAAEGAANPRATGAGGGGTNPRTAMRNVSFVEAPRITEPAQMGDWLTRLAGSYRVDGMADFNLLEVDTGNGFGGEPVHRYINVNGGADCVRVGTGPGVHCIFNITWVDQFEIIPPSTEDDAPDPGVFNLPGGDSFLDPAMSLIGLDPGKGALHLLLVDNKGLPEGGHGVIHGDRATFRTPCVNARSLMQNMSPDLEIRNLPPRTCERVTRVQARADSKVVNVSIYIEINDEPRTRFDLTLRRAASAGGERRGR